MSKLHEVISNIKEGKILYVLSKDNTEIKPIEVKDVIVDPTRYLCIYTKYLESETNEMIAFYPEDFGVIIFQSKEDAEKRMLQNSLEQYHDKYLSLYKQMINMLNRSKHPEVKNVCLIEIQKIKQLWEELHFNLKELTDLETTYSLPNNDLEDFERQ